MDPFCIKKVGFSIAKDTSLSLIENKLMYYDYLYVNVQASTY